MAKRQKKVVQRQTRPAPKAARPPQPLPEESETGLLGGLRFVFLLIAWGATGMLVASHFHLFNPPGCGAGGGCDKAASSVLGSLRVGDMKWPVSFLGFAYYTAMLAALIVMRGRVTTAMQHMARLGALVSAFYIFVIILHAKEYFCAYCITSHVANFAFLATIELASVKRGAGFSLAKKTVLAAGIAFLLTSGALALGEKQYREKIRAEGDATADEIIQRAKGNEPAPQTQQAANKTAEPPKPSPSSGTINGETWEARAKRLNIPVNIDERVNPQGFTGRWRIGPEDAPIRIVAFSDYQCPDCKRVEDEVLQILMTRDDVSFSHKQFPFNKDCNPTFKAARSPHPNACWAARAAEAAGILRGNRGFWEMHFWLYGLKDDAGVNNAPGYFSDATLIRGLQQLGYDPVEFQRIMQSADTLAPIAAECQEGASLGLMFTPLIYINGVEFRSWHSPGSLTRAVQRIADSNPSRGSPTMDVPAGALQKAVEDWKVQTVWPKETLARQGFSMARGPEDAKVNIIYFGDYEDEHTHDLNRVIQQRYKDRPDVRVEFRHYPLHEDCNMFAERVEHTVACPMAKAAEGAGRIGGAPDFWKMHDWLMQTGAKYTEDAMKQFASTSGLDSVAILEQAGGEEIRSTIFQDCKLVRSLQIRAVPCVIVNNRMVPRWRLNDGTYVLDAIFDAAEAEAGMTPQPKP